MKFFLAIALAITLAASSINAMPIEDAFIPCAAVCEPLRPACPVDEEPTGIDGCWGCCVRMPNKPISTLAA